MYNVIIDIEILQVVEKQQMRMPSGQEYAGFLFYYGSAAVTVETEVHHIFYAWKWWSN